VSGNTSCECLVLRERILSEIKRLAAATGKPPGVAAFTRDTGIAQSEWYGVIWARWSDALSEAGLQSNTLQGRFDSAAVLRRLAEISRDRKAVPTTPEIKILRRSDLSMPNPKTITAHFGNREELMEALREFCIENEGFESLLSSLPISQRNKSKPPRQTVQGWVYLLKSSQHYKIGRSDQIERRLKEISIALPESTKLIHAIQTDDPVGIEAYWHKRFADRRANGEWFRLSMEDVAAFRRRSFQ